MKINNLRLNLLTGIIAGSDGVSMNKYSTAFNCLKAIIVLELSEKKDKLPKQLFKDFSELEKQADNLSEKFPNIPLLIIEQYFLRNNKTLDAEIYIEYNHLNISVVITELYILLEDFYFKMYLLAVQIADAYNLEIKIKSERTSQTDYL